MEAYKRVYAQINLNHIKDNFRNMAALTGDKSKFIAVIKANAYGHGDIEVAKALEWEDKLHGFAVATAEEALRLRDCGIWRPVLVLGYTFPEDYKVLAGNRISLSVFREDSLELLSKAAEETGQRIRVHVKVDTGMHRIGITPDEAGMSFVEKLLRTKGLQLEGIFTHFARADEADKSNALAQLEAFQRFVSLVEDRFGITIPYKHCANSAAIMEMPDSYLDLVRAGVALYGMWPSDEVSRDVLELKPALSLYSHIVYIKEIPTGAAVSYGGTFVAEHPMRIATIPVGYGDGYPRGLSNCGEVLIHGKRAPILGRVCMDQFMVDVTLIPEASLDDMVTLIGCDGEERITIEELGALGGRFNYELACDLGSRIPRVYAAK